MNPMTSYTGKNRLHRAGPAMVLILAAALMIIPYCAHAKTPKQRSFPTPTSAVEALV
jgi:hypothetical protein